MTWGPWDGEEPEAPDPPPRPERVWAVWPHAQVCTGNLVDVSVQPRGRVDAVTPSSSAPPDSLTGLPTPWVPGYQEEGQQQNRTSLLAEAEAPAATEREAGTSPPAPSP